MRIVQARFLEPGQKIRVLVVDDSVVIRRLVTHVLEEDPLIEVAGVAANGAIALKSIAAINPDVMTLDIEMPEMDGLELLRHVRRDCPALRVIMFSTMTERGASATLEALALGADDYVTKASNAGSLDVSLANLRSELLPKIRQFFRVPTTAEKPTVPAPGGMAGMRNACRRPEVVCLGVSTGGPTALGTIFPQFPADFPLPVLVVQHMPPLFTRFLAERLNTLGPLRVAEAENEQRIEAGRVYVAPGDFHMRVARRGNGTVIALDQAPPENSCRPSVDVLFASAADAFGGAVVAAVLTGMGQDGLRGSRRLFNEGACVLAQDEASSVVWGMPGAVVNAAVATRTLPLEAVVPAITGLL